MNNLQKHDQYVISDDEFYRLTKEKAYYNYIDNVSSSADDNYYAALCETNRKFIKESLSNNFVISECVICNCRFFNKTKTQFILCPKNIHPVCFKCLSHIYTTIIKAMPGQLVNIIRCPCCNIIVTKYANRCYIANLKTHFFTLQNII
jgi:hypothetical protein